MADIRYNTEFLDDFQRANEIPIQYPWVYEGFSATTASLVNNAFQGGAGDTQYRWEGLNAGPYNTGDDPLEVWGQPGPGCDLTEALRIGFFTSSGTGYMLIIINGLGTAVWDIRHYTGGFSVIDSVAHEFPFGFPNDLVLVRIEGGLLTTWYSVDNGDNWEGPINSVGASGSGLYMFLGTSTDDGANPSWKGFGGGTLIDEIPQIYRRPNE